MELGVHYSLPSVALKQQGRIAFDRFKCPAWPELVATAQALGPVYVHLPLRAGAGRSEVIDTERKRPMDWARFQGLLASTGTPYINVHLVPAPEDHPHLPVDSADRTTVDLIGESLLRDVRSLTARFGSRRVIAENDSNDWGRGWRAAILPEVINRVVREAGCGFLLDLAHARLAAEYLGVDVHDYTSALPVDRIREIHITGVQPFSGDFLERVRRAGTAQRLVADLAGKPIDHLPMTDPDWDLLAWALDQVAGGAWAEPGIVSFEYGGVGGFWEAVVDAGVLEAQVPRMYEMVRAANEALRERGHRLGAA